MSGVEYKAGVRVYRTVTTTFNRIPKGTKGTVMKRSIMGYLVQFDNGLQYDCASCFLKPVVRVQSDGST